MRIYKMLATLLLLPALYSCQSELPQDNNSPETPQETGEPYKLTVKATVPGSNNTRAQITYGNTSINEETFIWDKEEEINLINITRINDCPFGVILYEVKLSEDKRTAEFGYVASEHPNFTVKQGDVILAVYGEINRDAYKDNAGNVIYDERNIIHLGVGTEGNKPQYIYNLNTSTPQDLTESLSYMKDNLKMYDIVTAVEDGKVPDLHFKHLSAIFRITLHNASGKDLYPTKLEFEYPPSNDSTTNPEDNNEDTRSGENNEKSDSNDIAGSLLSFFNTTLYFSVAGNEADGYYLKVYDTKEFFTSSSNAYTDHIGTTINGKDDTDDIGDSILNGETYDLYISTVPRIGNDCKYNELRINLIVSHLTKTPYSITINNFDKVIEAGKRYWFKLTATPEGTLMLTSEWDKLQQQQNSSSEGSN